MRESRIFFIFNPLKTLHMTSLWIAFIVLHAVSSGFALLALWRLYEYIKRYRFDESKYTLLFRFVHLHWIVTAYVLAVILWIPASYLFIALI